MGLRSVLVLYGHWIRKDHDHVREAEKMLATFIVMGTSSTTEHHAQPHSHNVKPGPGGSGTQEVSDDEKIWFTDARHLARVKQAFKSYSDRIGKSWLLTFHVPAPKMAVRYLKLLGPWLDVKKGTRFVDPIPPSCNCTHWRSPQYLKDQEALLRFASSGDKRKMHFQFGASPSALVGQLLAFHIDSVLGTGIVPFGNLFSVGVDHWKEWFTEHVCCRPDQMQEYTGAMPDKTHLRAFGWISEMVEVVEAKELVQAAKQALPGRRHDGLAGLNPVHLGATYNHQGLERMVDGLTRQWLFESIFPREDGKSNEDYRMRTQGNLSWVEPVDIDNDVYNEHRKNPSSDLRLDFCLHLPDSWRDRMLSTDLAAQVNISIHEREIDLPPQLMRLVEHTLHHIAASFRKLQAQLKTCTPAATRAVDQAEASESGRVESG